MATPPDPRVHPMIDLDRRAIGAMMAPVVGGTAVVDAGRDAFAT